MKRFVYTITLFLIALISTTLSAANPADWKTYFKNDTVKIEYAYQVCDFSSTASQELVIFKFTNLSSQKILLSYKANIWNNDICINCEQKSEESRYTIQVLSNETIITKCDNDWKKFAIFSAFITNNKEAKRYNSLTKFELTEINIRHE